MFKRFLKFLKGDTPIEDPRFEGSYLDHLLTEVRPTVSTQLDECPGHDPLLLIVVNILRTTLREAWSDGLRQPLTDAQTPGAKPPPPPSSRASDGTAEVDVLDTDPAVEGDAESVQESTDEDMDPVDLDESESEAPLEEDAAEAAEETEAEDEGESQSVEDSEIVAKETSASSQRITEEIDISELKEVAQSEDVAVENPTAEHDATVEIDESVVAKAAELPRVDSEEVLQAGRLFLGLLIENDRLPTDLQLSVGELMLARDLLLGYFVSDEGFDGKAKRLLTMVEKKFGDGLFSQARILLQLFQTDESTRVNNDRNLFYEDMILRLGIRRRHQLSADELDHFAALMDAATNDEGQREVAAWLDSECLIKLHLYLQDSEAAAVWAGVAEKSTREPAVELLLERVPPRRWRPITSVVDMPVELQVREHVTLDTTRRYIVHQIKTCYFILRAVGDTGLEGYLDTFFDWASTTFDINGTQLMPLLYNRSMMDTDSMDDILAGVYEEFFEEPVNTLFESFDEGTVTDAMKGAITKLKASNLGEIAPGYYDFGGFVFDELFAVSYPTPEFAAKIHRLT